MPAHYSKERSKYGSGTGSIITWPVELTSTDPNAEDNINALPAGYLKCDGTIYKADDYPQLCLLYTSPSPRDVEESRMPSSA